MEDLGLLEIVLPEIQALKGVAQPAQYHKEGDVYNHTMQALGSIPEGEPLSLYWAVLLHDIGKPDTFSLEERIRFDGHAEKSSEIARDILKRLKFSRNFIKKVCWLVEQHMSVYNVLEMPKATRIKWFLKPWFLELLELNKHDILGTDPQDLSTYKEIKELYSKEVGELPDKLPKILSGKDIMEIKGMKPGPALGSILEELEDLQLESIITTREQALEWLVNYPEHE
jgi:poly(A) polymerase